MIARERNKRQRIQYGQAILLGVQIDREVDQAYAKPRWYARVPKREGERMTPICGPWGTRHQAVTHALTIMGVSPCEAGRRSAWQQSVDELLRASPRARSRMRQS